MNAHKGLVGFIWRAGLSALIVVAAAALAACGGSVSPPSPAPSADGVTPSPAMSASPPVASSPSPSATISFAQQVVGLYFDRLSPEVRLLLWDDGRYQYWNGAELIEGRYTLYEGDLEIRMPELMGSFTYDPGTRSFGHQVTADELREFARVNDDAKAAADRYGADAEGKSDEELAAELEQLVNQMDDEIMRELDQGTSQPSPAPTPSGPQLTRADVAGTYGRDDVRWVVTLHPDGTYVSGTGLAVDYGLFAVSGTRITFSEDPTHDLSNGVPVCGTLVTFDPGSRELIDAAGLRWDRRPSPEPTYAPM